MRKHLHHIYIYINIYISGIWLLKKSISLFDNEPWMTTAKVYCRWVSSASNVGHCSAQILVIPLLCYTHYPANMPISLLMLKLQWILVRTAFLVWWKCAFLFLKMPYSLRRCWGGGGLRLYHSFIPSFFSPFAYQHIDIFYLYTEITGLLSSFQSSTSTLISAPPLLPVLFCIWLFLYLSSTGIFMTQLVSDTEKPLPSVWGFFLGFLYFKV